MISRLQPERLITTMESWSPYYFPLASNGLTKVSLSQLGGDLFYRRLIIAALLRNSSYVSSTSRPGPRLQ